MDCLRSFNISINQNVAYAAIGNIKSWANGTNQYFIIEDGFPNLTTFEIEGFKNINIFGMSVVGSIMPQLGALTNSAIIDDWSFEIVLNGQLPLISGVVTNNYFNISSGGIGNKTFYLSKNTNSIMFETPFQSVESIDFNKVKMQGYGVQTLGNVATEWDLNFTFYYKYEGE